MPKVTLKKRELLIDAEDAHLLELGRLELSGGYPRLVLAKDEEFSGVLVRWVAYVPLHRFIVRAPKGKWVDHVNGDVFDVRRLNLRLATAQENSRNRISKQSVVRSKGVVRSGNRWMARICVGGKSKNLGSYASREVAARVYDKHAVLLFGKFARLNYPENLDTAASFTPPFERKTFVNSSTGYRGVSVAGDRFMASLSANGQRYYLGHFDSAKAAAKAYDAKATEILGSRAKTNFKHAVCA